MAQAPSTKHVKTRPRTRPRTRPCPPVCPPPGPLLLRAGNAHPPGVTGPCIWRTRRQFRPPHGHLKARYATTCYNMLQHATTLANIADAPPNLVNLLEFLPPSCSLLTSSNISLHLPALVATCCPFLWPLQLALHGAIQTTLSPRKGLTSVGILRLLDPRLDPSRHGCSGPLQQDKRTTSQGDALVKKRAGPSHDP